MAKISARGCRALATVDRETHYKPEEDTMVSCQREVRVLRSDLKVLRRFVLEWRGGGGNPGSYATFLDLRPALAAAVYDKDPNLVAAAWVAGRLMDGWELVSCEGPVSALLPRGENLARASRAESARRRAAKEAAFRGLGGGA